MNAKVAPAETYLPVLRALAYPFLFFSALFTIFLAFKFNLEFGLCNIAFLGWTVAYLSLLEQLIPYDRQWNPSAREWGRDGIYFLLTMLGGGSAVAALFQIAKLVKPLKLSLPLELETLLALTLSSLGSYAFHRISHLDPWLWQLHGIHHVEEKVNVGNNGVNHVLDVFGRRLLAQLPVFLLGLSPRALFISSIFNTMHGYFSHANIDVDLGWLNYLVIGPEQHRLHHSKDLAESGNYSTDITLWDIAFGTFTWKRGRKPQAVGIDEPEKFPAAGKILASFLHPFRSQKK